MDRSTVPKDAGSGGNVAPAGSQDAPLLLSGKARAALRGERAHQATLAEIAQEKATSLGRSGRRLEDALIALAAARSTGHVAPGPDTTTAACEDEAAEALYFYLVQREACGLRDHGVVLAQLAVPPEIHRRMGIRPRR